MEQYIKTFDEAINNNLGNYVRKPTVVRGLVHLLLILYAARLAPSLPKQVLVMFENAYFKLFVFSLVLWTAQFSPSTSILIAVAFMVSINYANQRPLWEFLDNVDSTASAVAPTKEVAVEAAVAIVNKQSEDSQVVTGVAQNQETIVIQPTIIDTPQGQTVVNPTIVVAPVVVSSASGEKIVVKPDVTIVEAPATDYAPAQAESSPASVGATVTAPVAQSGCYPLRRYDMAKVSAFESNDSFGTV
jgi:hypothetical protein